MGQRGKSRLIPEWGKGGWHRQRNYRHHGRSNPRGIGYLGSRVGHLSVRFGWRWGWE